ncbi:hypothetical protein [Pantoea sp. A4]|uniref:hypothetical protein n=1 Tax=Pantoea sp. A4 TaxID=1225184 RepID=UPI00037296CA|nr:hypothetical protein [Pantoea sp. A4]
MDKKLKIEILNNKDDLTEGTFCYLLFEDGVFDESLLINLIENTRDYLSRNIGDREIIDFLKWLDTCTNQCFSSHNEKDDLYTISNYKIEMEKKWHNTWEPMILRLIN